jgi:hypothetical protein
MPTPVFANHHLVPDPHVLLAAGVRIGIAGSDKISGTGFLVSDRKIVTCYHVVRGQPDSALKFDKVEGGQTATVAKIDSDEVLDCAVLTLKEPLKCTPLALATEESPDLGEWNSFGFPSFSQHGYDCAGKLRDRKAVDDTGVPSLQLYCVDLAAGEGQPFNGLSGAPVVSGGVVVGHVRKGISDKRFLPTGPAASGPRPEWSAVGGIIYATPVFAALKLLGLDTTVVTKAEKRIQRSVSEEKRRTDDFIKSLGGDLDAIEDYAKQCIKWRYVYGLLKIRDHQLKMSDKKGGEQFALALAQLGHAFYMVNDPQAANTWSNAQAIFESMFPARLESFHKERVTAMSRPPGWLLAPWDAKHNY